MSKPKTHRAVMLAVADLERQHGREAEHDLATILIAAARHPGGRDADVQDVKRLRRQGKLKGGRGPAGIVLEDRWLLTERGRNWLAGR